MPAVFLSSVQDLESYEFSEKPKSRFAQFYKSKAFYFICALVLFFFFDWNENTAQVVDVPTKHPDFIGRKVEFETLKRRLLVKKKGEMSI